MGCSSSKLFHITLITSCDKNHFNYILFLEYIKFFCSIVDNKKIFFVSINSIRNFEFPYKINRVYSYPYKFKEDLVKKFELIEKEFKEKFLNDQITIIFDKDVKSRVQVIERYWRRYRWNYLRNLAAWKYHPSRLTFEID